MKLYKVRICGTAPMNDLKGGFQIKHIRDKVRIYIVVFVLLSHKHGNCSSVVVLENDSK